MSPRIDPQTPCTHLIVQEALERGFVNALDKASNPILSRAAWIVTSYHMAILEGGKGSDVLQEFAVRSPPSLLWRYVLYIPWYIQHNHSWSSHVMNKIGTAADSRACVKIDVISEAEGRWNRHDQPCKKSAATNCTWEWRTASTTELHYLTLRRNQQEITNVQSFRSVRIQSDLVNGGDDQFDPRYGVGLYSFIQGWQRQTRICFTVWNRTGLASHVSKSISRWIELNRLRVWEQD